MLKHHHRKGPKQNPPQAQTDTLGIDKLVQEALQAPSIDHKRQENIKNTSDQGANENPTHAGGQAIGATSASALVALVQTIRPCWSLLNTSKTNNINVRIKVNLDRQGYVINKTVLAPTNISSNDPHYKKLKIALCRLYQINDASRLNCLQKIFIFGKS